MTKSIEQSVKDKVKSIAKEENKAFQEVWLAVCFERWLARLAQSPHRDKFIFKGGMCLAQYISLGRETRDLDFLLRNLASDRESIQAVFQEITEIDLADGYSFTAPTVAILEHDHMNYPGYRVVTVALLGKSKTKVGIDIGIGDAVTPQSLTLELSKTKNGTLFEKEIQLWAYPIETIFAEKFETAISRGEQNSRMKDYQDMVLLTRSGEMDQKKLTASLRATFENRGTKLRLLIVPSGSKSQLQSFWQNFRKSLSQELRDQIPDSVAQVISEINDAIWKLEILKS